MAEASNRLLVIGTEKKSEPWPPLLTRLAGCLEALLHTSDEAVRLGLRVQETVHDARRLLAVSRSDRSGEALLIFERLSLWRTVEGPANPQFPNVGPVSPHTAASDLAVMIQLVTDALNTQNQTPAGSVSSHAAEHFVRPFPLPKEKSWQDVSIRFTSDFAVQVTVGKVSDRRSYVEMGFEDKRKKSATATSPDSAWVLFREIAKLGGVVGKPPHAGEKAKWTKVETGVSSINKKLKAIFGLSANPIAYRRSDKCYRAEFHVEFPDADRV